MTKNVLLDAEYLEEFDTLSVRNEKQKIMVSKRIGNVVIDIDFNGKAIGAEILNASSVFDLDKDTLSSIKKAKIRNITAPNSVMVAIIFPLLNREIRYIVDLAQEEDEITV